MNFESRWFAYLLRRQDASLHPGSTDDLLELVKGCGSGRGSRRAHSSSPSAVVWSKTFQGKADAVREEARLRGLTMEEKEALLPWPCPTPSFTRANPLLSVFHSAYPPPPEGVSILDQGNWKKRLEEEETFRSAARDAATCYSWGVPTERVIRLIASMGPVVEMGAGNGYWAGLLRRVGADVIAFDEKPTWSRSRGLMDQNPWMAMGMTHGKVLRGTPKDLVGTSDRTLLLCWPPKDDPMAVESVKHWSGDRLVVVGPRKFVGSEELYEELMGGYLMVHDEPLPSWPGLEDSAQVWIRHES